MGKLWALFDLFRKGSAVSDPALWKTHQLSANALIPVVAAVLAAGKAFGYDLGLTSDEIASIAVGLLAVVNGVLTLTTSDKVGLPAKSGDSGGVPTVPNHVGADPAAVGRFVESIRDRGQG